MQPDSLFKIGFVIVASTVFASVVAGCVFWIGWFLGKQRRNLCGDPSPELITRLPQRYPGWTVAEFLLMFGVMLLVGASLQQVVMNDPEAIPAVSNPPLSSSESLPADAPIAASDDPPRSPDATDEPAPEDAAGRLVWAIRIHFLANLAAFLITLLFLRLVHGLTPGELTLIPSRADLRRGAFATLWILAPVLLLNLILANLVKYEHPVTDFLAEESGPATFAALLLSTGLITPIVEEFQFRLLLQGGLQRFADPPTPADQTPGNQWHMWRPTRAWPIYVTSFVFALMHFGQGAAPIPLFFLSVGLGYLYQRTGRLVPAIIVHLLLNTATLCMEFCRVNAGL